MDHGSPSSNNNRSTQSSSVPLPRTREEELRLPIRNLTRIMQHALPLRARITYDAKESIQLCVSEFMGIVTSEANGRCIAENRKIVSAEDIIWAMNRLGFEDYVGPLSILLQKYRTHEAQLRGMSTASGINMDGSGASGSSSGNGQH